MHGNVPIENIKERNREGLTKGFANLDKHIENMKSFGQNVLVALNRYGFDSEEEIKLIRDHCYQQGVSFALNDSFTKGGEGAIEFAEEIVRQIGKNPSPALSFTYEDNDPIEEKINKIAKSIYGAASVSFGDKARKKLALVERQNLNHYPVCIAKTQYSFSDNAHAYGTINDIVINNGAEFIVAIAGSIMRMPGLPAIPQAEYIDIIDGKIVGLS